jgi:hypothetical protein
VHTAALANFEKKLFDRAIRMNYLGGLCSTERLANYQIIHPHFPIVFIFAVTREHFFVCPSQRRRQ